MSEGVRVRFAPSPTGILHIGNVRTALFNFLFARHQNGKFILRIDDTDLKRSSKDLENKIMEDLKWLGLHWDEGPDKGGKFGPYRQSERLEIYNMYIERLLKEGKGYYCFCRSEELKQRREELIEKGLPPKYDGRCKNLSSNQKQRLVSEGEKPSIRFEVTASELIVQDIVKGEVQFSPEEFGDFIIQRSDGIPSYNFVTVIDDALMEISHVIRGEDHLSNTPKQIMLYKALSLPIPKFAHLPMIMGKGRTLLSKRIGGISISSFRKMGYLPHAMLNYLALLSWSFEDGRERASLEELIKNFSLERVSSSPAVFDIDKLNWLNGYYIRQMDTDSFYEACYPYLRDSEKFNTLISGKEKEKIIGLIDGLKGNINCFSEILKNLEFLFKEDIELTGDGVKLVQSDLSKQVVKIFYKKLSEHKVSEEINYKTIMGYVKEKTGASGKELFMPLRIFLTGRMKGPELDRVINFLGKEQCMLRIAKTWEKLFPEHEIDS